jgi:hypothetical protein
MANVRVDSDGSVSVDMKIQVESIKKEAGLDMIKVDCLAGQQEVTVNLPFIFVAAK